MKDKILLFLFLVPTFLFAQYPTTGNKSRLGWQTTGDGLIWRGIAGDTVNKPNNRNYPYFQLDTVNAVLYRYIQTRGQWQAVGGGSIDIDSLVYATRFWVNSNFFPLQGGLLTGTGGSGFVGFPLQSSPPATPSTGFSLFAGSTGNNISWMQPDGFFRRLVSPVTGTPRQYQFMARSYTLADSADIANNVTSIAANYLATSNGTNLVARNLFDNNTYVGILNNKPFSLGQWTTAGRPSSVDGYIGRNTTTGFDEGYFSSEWRNYVTSTGASNGQVSIFSSAGQTYGTNNLLWDNTNKYLYINTPTPPSPAYHLNITSSGTISQRWLGMYNSSNIIQCAFTSDGSGNGAVHAYNNVGTLQGKFSSGDLSFLVGKMVFGNTVIASGSDFLVQLRQTDIGLNARINIGGSGGGFPGVGYNTQFTTSGNTYTKKATGVSYFIDFGSNSRFSMKTSPSAASGSTITWAEPFAIDLATNFIGINQTSPQRQLHVTGEARITDLITDTPTRFVGADADGDLGQILLNSVWRDYQTDKAILGTDSSFIHDPSVDTTRVLGTAAFGKASTLGSPTVSGYPFIFRNPSSSSTYVLIESGRTSPSAGAAGIRLLPSGNFTSIIEYGTSTGSALQFSDKGSSKINFQIGSSQFVTGNRRTVIVGSDDPTQWGANGTLVIYDTITTGKAMFLAKKVTSSSTPLAMFSSAANDRFTFNDDGTTRFHIYGTPATTAAALSKTLTNYGVGFATDGTVTSRELKRDTTIYVTDADYDFSAAITTAQIASRFNRVIFWMTTTAAAGSDSELTLHTPDANLMQVEYLIHSVDEPAGFDNKIVFGTNNAVDSTNGLVTNYYPAAGDGIHIRAGLRSGVYKYRYSN